VDGIEMNEVFEEQEEEAKGPSTEPASSPAAPAPAQLEKPSSAPPQEEKK